MNAVRVKIAGAVSGVAAFILLSAAFTSASEIPLNGHQFTLPDGFEIELAAGPPLVNRPITADFDERGFLYVADSSGSNEKVDKQVIERTHRIVRLEDTDGDGVFDKSVVFADKMMFPEGTLWYDGSLYVAAPPSIWKLTDTDGDGVADQRSEWFQGKTLTGCANDLHGPYLGPDGWIYWCKGAFAEQTYPQPPRLKSVSGAAEPRTLVTKASHIFRCKPDGSGYLENVMTGGMDNPVDVVSLPSGERVFTTTFLQNPGGGLRDGLIHAVYGGVYGKVHNVTDFHPRTGDLMPPLAHMGPAAPCGLEHYKSNVFGDEYRDNLFACQFNMHKVSRHVLEPDGATFKSTNSDFVVSSSLDFHPTDVLEDADGSLIINDTGGWYTLCCPTSQLTKPDILGGIYRVRRKGAAKVVDARGGRLNWQRPTEKELVTRLGDARPAVVERSMQEISRCGAKVIEDLSKEYLKSTRPELRRNIVWATTRIDHSTARALIRLAAKDPDTTVRLAALHSISLWRDHDAIGLLETLLKTDLPAVRRVAAEALGKMESEQSISALLQAAASPEADRFLQHSLTYALIEIAKPIELEKVPQELQTPALQRIVTIANDQMPGGQVDPQQVVPWLKSKEPVLKETALWLVGRHPEWGDALSDYLREQLSSTHLTDEDRAEVVQQLARFSGNPAIQAMLATYANAADQKLTTAAKLMVLEAMRRSELKEMPASWLEALTLIVEQGDADLAPAAIGTLRTIPVKAAADNLKTGLLRLASDSKRPAPVRVEALAAIPGGVSRPSDELFKLLVDNLGEEANVGTRSASVDVLVKSKLDTSFLLKLADAVPSVGPLELNRLLGAFENCTQDEIGLRLIAALKQSPVLTSLRVDAVKLRLAKFPDSVKTQAEELYAVINVEAARQQEKLNQMLAEMPEGDIRRGQLVFNSQKAACSACHAIGYIGGNIGPDLSRIGKIRTERDLLESVLFPSVSFVRSFEPMLIVTKSGKQVNGLVRKETSDEITLVTGAKEEARVARADIDEIRPGTVSIMPAGLDTQLTRQQIADLIAFLKAKQ